MYESENCTPFMLAKQTVIICKPGTKLSNLPAKRVAPAYIVMDVRFIVMNVHFDIADSKTNHLRKAFEQIVPVTFLRVEEAVLGTLAGGVSWSVIGDARPLVTPTPYTVQRSLNRFNLAQRLVMICDGNPGTLGLCGPHAFS
jgi:hypothetical protein